MSCSSVTNAAARGDVLRRPVGVYAAKTSISKASQMQTGTGQHWLSEAKQQRSSWR